MFLLTEFLQRSVDIVYQSPNVSKTLYMSKVKGLNFSISFGGGGGGNSLVDSR